MGKGYLHFFEAWYVDKGCLVRLKLNSCSFLEVHISDNDFRAFFYAELIHHPDRNVAGALLSDELEIAAVGFDSHLRI